MKNLWSKLLIVPAGDHGLSGWCRRRPSRRRPCPPPRHAKFTGRSIRHGRLPERNLRRINAVAARFDAPNPLTGRHVSKIEIAKIPETLLPCPRMIFGATRTRAT
jgi:hypothetical protein